MSQQQLPGNFRNRGVNLTKEMEELQRMVMELTTLVNNPKKLAEWVGSCGDSPAIDDQAA